MISSSIHHPISEINDYMFGCGLPSTETTCITKIHLLPKLTSLSQGSNNSVLVTRLFLITRGDPSSAQKFPSVFNLSDPDSWNPTAALPTREVFVKNLKSSNGVSLNSSFNSNSNSPSSSSPPGACSSPLLNSSRMGNLSSKYAIGIVIPLESPEEDLMDILITNWDEISHYLILLQKVIAKKLISLLRSSLDTTTFGSSSFITHTKRIQFPNWILQHEPDILHQYYKLIKLISYDTNLPRLINSNALIKTSMSKTSSKYNSLLLNWVLEVLNWLEFKDNKQLAKPSIQTTTASKTSTISLTTVSNSITFNNNKGPTQASNVPFLSSSSLKQGSMMEYSNTAQAHNGISESSGSGPNSNNNNPDVFKTYHTFLATLFSLVLPLRKKLTHKPISDNGNEDEIKRKHKDVTRIVIMTGNPAVAKKLIFILNALVPDDSLYDSCKLDFSIVDEGNEVLSENEQEEEQQEEQQQEEEEKPLSYGSRGDPASLSKNGKTSAENINHNMTTLLPTTSAASHTSAEKVSMTSPLTQKSVYTSSDDLSSFLEASPSVETVRDPTVDSKSKSPTVEPIPIRSGKRDSNSPIGTRAISDQSFKIGWELPYKSTPHILTSNKNSSSAATSSVEASTATAQVIPISYNPPQLQQLLNNYHRNNSMLKSSSFVYLSSSLNSSLSSLSSQFSLSKLGGSFLEKWKWPSSYSNQSLQNTSGGNSVATPNAVYNNMNCYFGQQTLGQSVSNSHKLNLSSLMNQGSTNGSSTYYNSSLDASECLPPSTIGSLTKRSSVHSLRTPSPAIVDHYDDIQSFQPISSHHQQHLIPTPNKLSRTQSMYELYNKTSTNMPGIYDNSTGVLAIKDNLTLKRSNNSAYLPLIDDSAVKNVVAHNNNCIKRKCSEIMNSKKLEVTKNETLNALEIPLYTNKELDGSLLIKKKPLLPVVAFADEFRPEFTIQSCPMSPKLENQILIAMKNDVLFYQTHCQFESVTSRTIFVSLRARELKVLEMTGTTINNPTSTSDSEGFHTSLSNDGTQSQYTQLGVSPQKPSTSFKLNPSRKKHSSYTSSKPLTQSERNRISAIDSVFDEIAHLVSASQAKLARRTEAFAEEEDDEGFTQPDDNICSPTIAGFDHQLSKLMTKLFQ
ncbi:uncharacterized protein KQ657_003525 [Scheffersomyces spartinae]|uniref:Protein LST4 n=1 Tax=Scheffersomyces spartinae TaxID=45513 RepID=A0A9P7V542_9ASCO|nr:uncharacterized protein KQ657_003525 [Scheffersomyces spartinae]KAG7191353.1 hypothetical protein KQ657_003525 [Scheffersomyces spartinae]